MRPSQLWFFPILGVLCSSLALFALVKDGFNVSLYGFSNSLYGEYRFWTNLFYELTAEFLLDVQLPRWSKDVLTILFTFNALVYRSIRTSAKRILDGRKLTPDEDGWDSQEASRNILLLVNRWTFPLHMLAGPLSHVCHMIFVRQLHRRRTNLQQVLHPREAEYSRRYAERSIVNIVNVTAKRIAPVYVEHAIFMFLSVAAFFLLNYVEQLARATR